MRFARYFQDTQTPEWKKAYIDYHGLQAELGSIQTMALSQPDSPSSLMDTYFTPTHHPVSDHQISFNDFEGAYVHKKDNTFTGMTRSCVSETEPIMSGTMDLSNHRPSSFATQITSKQEGVSVTLTLPGLPPRTTRALLNLPEHTPSLPKTPRSPVSPFFKDSGSPARSPSYAIFSEPPIIHANFFGILDAELAKVETFYTEREREMYEHSKLLREQLDELNIHRQIFYESSAHSKLQRVYLSILLAWSSLVQWFSYFKTKPAVPHQAFGNDILASGSDHDGRLSFVNAFNLDMQVLDIRLGSNYSGCWRKDDVIKNTTDMESSAAHKSLHSSTRLSRRHSNGPPSLSFGQTKHTLNPHQYQHAKKQLREAIVEHYRGLEILNNYRILNLAGVSKALKRYGKITKNAVWDAYMKEKVKPCAFASGAMVTTMLKETEHLFATRFESGNRKKAIRLLRIRQLLKTYHFTVFRSGLWMGFALPAIARSAYLSCLEYKRSSLQWDILSYTYSILILPVLLALLIGINILVWTRKRINYPFILELDPRSRLDYREYYELPSFLLCTLAYAFWFSLAQVGSPMLWPLIWLALTFVVIFNPFRSLMGGCARWWTIKNMTKLVASWLWRVEFIDAWLGDQFCSLAYSLSGLYFVGCFYIRFPDIAFSSLPPSAYNLQAQEALSMCSTARNFGWYSLFSVSPFMLINAGKYGMSMIHQFCYCYWRNQAAPHYGKSFILWCFVATINSIYGCTWDFLMDWSLFKPHAQYPLLRPVLIYNSEIPFYYFALVSNLCIRFIWLVFLFVDEAQLPKWSFIAAVLEVLRRMQWNFYRLENKQLENVDRCHVTRKLPLPYSLDARSDGKTHCAPSWWKQQLTRFTRREKKRGSTSINTSIPQNWRHSPATTTLTTLTSTATQESLA